MTGSHPTRRPRNGAHRAPDSDALARLTAARDHLDADLAAARLREDELLAEYATIEAAATGVLTRRDTALADLDRKARAVRAEADDALAAVEARRGDVLARLSRRRSAEELHALVGLPLRRIRRVLQQHRQPADGGPAATSPAQIRSPDRTAPDRTAPDPTAPAPAGPAPAATSPAALLMPSVAPESGAEDARPPVSVLPDGEHHAPSTLATKIRVDAVAAEHR